MNEVIQAMVERRSCRSFRPEQLDPEVLAQILRAGTYAPTGRGLQSPKIVVLQDAREIAELERMNAEFLGNPEAHPFFGAPTVCVVLAKADVHTAVEDGSLVIGNLLLAAHTLGVGGCWIHRAREEFADERGKALLQRWGVEGNYIGVGHCILGYPAQPAKAASPRKEDYIVLR